jgi:hypothetical protein
VAEAGAGVALLIKDDWSARGIVLVEEGSKSSGLPGKFCTLNVSNGLGICKAFIVVYNSPLKYSI